MSTTLLTVGDAQLTRFCGPADLGPDRVCYQIDGPKEIGKHPIYYVVLTSAEARAVAVAILRDLVERDSDGP